MGAIECVVPAGDRCGEGAIWSADEGAIYWTDINRFLIHRLDMRSGNTRSWLFDEPVTALALTSEKGWLLASLASRLILWAPASDTREDYGFSLDDYPAARLNDGRADPRGEFWVGSMKNNVGPDGEAGEVGKGLGRLFRVTGDKHTVLKKKIGIANTLCWNREKTRFFFADTLENCIWAYDYDVKTGDISNEKVHFKGFERGSPDGSAIDAQGYLYNARYGGACIVRIAPDGSLDRVIEAPCANITTCCFGGQDLTTLYFTSAANDHRKGDRLSGSLFSMRVSVGGLPENKVAL